MIAHTFTNITLTVLLLHYLQILFAQKKKKLTIHYELQLQYNHFLMIDEVISLTCDQAAIFVSLGEIFRREERNEILASDQRKRI